MQHSSGIINYARLKQKYVIQWYEEKKTFLQFLKIPTF